MSRNCEINFTKSNCKQIDIGNFWTVSISSTTTEDDVTTPEDYTNITLDGCVSSSPSNISLTEQPSDNVTGLYKIDANNFSLNLDISTTTSVNSGSYPFAIYGTPIDGKRYTIISGTMQFNKAPNCP